MLFIWRAPSGNTVNDVHDYQKPSNWQDWTSRTIPTLGSDLNGSTLHTIAARVFLKIRVPNATLGPSEEPMTLPAEMYDLCLEMWLV